MHVNQHDTHTHTHTHTNTYNHRHTHTHTHRLTSVPTHRQRQPMLIPNALHEGGQANHNRQMPQHNGGQYPPGLRYDGTATSPYNVSDQTACTRSRWTDLGRPVTGQAMGEGAHRMHMHCCIAHIAYTHTTDTPTHTSCGKTSGDQTRGTTSVKTKAGEGRALVTETISSGH